MHLKQVQVTLLLLVFFILNYIPKGLTTFRRIINGQSKTIDKYPYMASLRVGDIHQCGASIITNQHLITAAHCKYYPVTSFYQVVVGATETMDNGLKKELIYFEVHEEFDEKSLKNDIAIIQVEDNFIFMNKVNMIKLPQPNFQFKKDMMFTIAGWGSTMLKIVDNSIHPFMKALEKYLITPDSRTRSLQVASVPYVCRSKCIQVYPNNTISTSMFCAGNSNTTKDACQGDSGGALMYRGFLIGIISWGWGCGDPRYYGVYTDVSKYIDWIMSWIGKDINT